MVFTGVAIGHFIRCETMFKFLRRPARSINAASCSHGCWYFQRKKPRFSTPVCRVRVVQLSNWVEVIIMSVVVSKMFFLCSYFLPIHGDVFEWIHISSCFCPVALQNKLAAPKAKEKGNFKIFCPVVQMLPWRPEKTQSRQETSEQHSRIVPLDTSSGT